MALLVDMLFFLMRDGIRETRLGSRTSTGSRDVLCVAFPANNHNGWISHDAVCTHLAVCTHVPLFLSLRPTTVFFPARRAFIGTNR
jgi:hypothetical protein